jgi:hypothetical protein
MWKKLTRYDGSSILVNMSQLSNIERKGELSLLRGNSTTRSITVRESFEELELLLCPTIERDPAELTGYRLMAEQFIKEKRNMEK